MADTGFDGRSDLEQALLGDLPTMIALRSVLDTARLDKLRSGGLRASVDDLPLVILRGAGMVDCDEAGIWRLTADMGCLWTAKGKVIEARLRFLLMAAADMLVHGNAAFSDREAFVAQAATFGFFCYGRATGTGAAQIEDTETWVRYVAALNAEEAPILAPLLPLKGCSRLLEVGGNTGGFAARLLHLNPDLRAVVLDLPAVCQIGARERVADPHADRLSFVPGDARDAVWPEVEGIRPDAILFKSVLHDWSAERSLELLRHAVDHLAPGGRVIVCERGAMSDEPRIKGIEAVANLVFAPFYRAPKFYEEVFTALGLTVLPSRTARLDMAFHVVAGIKPF